MTSGLKSGKSYSNLFEKDAWKKLLEVVQGWDGD